MLNKIIRKKLKKNAEKALAILLPNWIKIKHFIELNIFAIFNSFRQIINLAKSKIKKTKKCIKIVH